MSNNNERLARLRGGVRGGADSKLRLDNPDAFITIHHILMKEYGWIPLKEFRELPLPTLWGLLECIEKQQETEKRQLEKSKRGRR